MYVHVPTLHLYRVRTASGEHDISNSFALLRLAPPRFVRLSLCIVGKTPNRRPLGCPCSVHVSAISCRMSDPGLHAAEVVGTALRSAASQRTLHCLGSHSQPGSHRMAIRVILFKHERA